MSSETECIAKTGVVQSIEGQKVYVKVTSASACASCHAHGSCTSSEIKEQIIEADAGEHTNLKPGELVSVKVDLKAGNMALFYGYVLPFFLVFVMLLIATTFTSEGIAGLLSLSILLPYYAILYLLRNQMGKRYKFTIEV